MFPRAICTWLVPPLISGFLIAHPKVRFELRQYGETANPQAVLDGMVDLIFTSDDRAARRYAGAGW